MSTFENTVKLVHCGQASITERIAIAQLVGLERFPQGLKPPRLPKPKRESKRAVANVYLETSLYEKGKERAASMEYPSFSEYLRALMMADIQSGAPHPRPAENTMSDGRKAVTRTCSRCRLSGHNAQTCLKPLKSSAA